MVSKTLFRLLGSHSFVCFLRAMLRVAPPSVAVAPAQIHHTPAGTTSQRIARRAPLPCKGARGKNKTNPNPGAPTRVPEQGQPCTRWGLSAPRPPSNKDQTKPS